MADYKRFVSYMYEYENGLKKRNVGYARVETRNGECRFTIHMQLNGVHEGIFPTYLIYRPSEEMDLVYLGDAIVKNQIMDSKISARELNIMDTGYDFSDMGGILLFLNSGVFYATQWDDKPVILEEVLNALKPKPDKKPTDIISDAMKVEETEARRHKYIFPGEGPLNQDLLHSGLKKHINPWELVEKYKEAGEKKDDTFDAGPTRYEENKPQDELKESGDEEKTVDYEEETGGYDKKGAESVKKAAEHENIVPEHAKKTIEHENMVPENAKKAAEYVNKATEHEIRAAMGIKQEADESLTKRSFNEARSAGSEYKAANAGMAKNESKAADIFALFPRIYPFEDNEITRCVKVEPKDIGALPSDTWIMSNNSFLLHGYYCYHHLIFAEIIDRYGCRYILGVPGIYHNRERFMARMFGFECFKSIRKRELRQGDFGYWYREVNL